MLLVQTYHSTYQVEFPCFLSSKLVTTFWKKIKIMQYFEVCSVPALTVVVQRVFLKFRLLLHNGVHHIKVCWNYLFCFLRLIAGRIYTPRTHALHFRTGVMRVQCMRLNPAPLFLAAPYCYWEELFLCRYPWQKRDNRLSSTLKSH
jgi:hypothetical protein